ncbi:hypothetical protein H7X87_00805 [Acetobacteraceae bacterium]|nr:hypothetical protein [Candidatus Parcubacteria bacterium]
MFIDKNRSSEELDESADQHEAQAVKEREAAEKRRTAEAAEEDADDAEAEAEK